MKQELPPASSQHPLFCDIPLAGQEIRIVYQQDHDDAFFNTADSLVATISVQTKDRANKYRVLLQADDKLFSALYKVPNDAVYLRIDVAPPGVIRTPENARSIVYRGEEHAVEGVAKLMRLAQSHTELKELFSDTAMTSNDSYAQWPVFALRSLQLKAKAEHLLEFQKRAEARLMAMEQASGIEKFNLHLTIANITQAYADRSTFNSSLTKLIECAESLHQRVHFTSQVVLGDMVNQEIQIAVAQDNPEQLKQLARIVSTLNSAYLQNRLFTAGLKNGKVISRFPEPFEIALNSLAEGWQNWNRCDLISNYSLFVVAANCAKRIGWTAVLEEISQAFNNYQEVPVWFYDDPQQCVAADDVSGIQVGVTLALARIYTAEGDRLRGLEYYRKTLARKGKLTLGAKSLAAIDLANLFLREGSLDSAEKYYAIAELNDSPFAEGVRESINQMRDSLDLAPIATEEVLNKYMAFKPTFVAQEIHGELKTVDGSINYNSSGPIVLLFSSVDCSVCTELMPPLYDELKSTYPENHIIVVSTDPPDLVKQLYGDGVEIAPLTRETAAIHKVQMLPAIQVIRKNKIELNRSNVSSTSTEQLHDYFSDLALE